MSKTINQVQLEKFQTRLNTAPNPKKLAKTPDGKADDLPISYVEMTLDELYFGLWETVNFKSQLITNEVVGSLELRVFHPITQQWISRTGTASIQIMVDRVPDGVTGQEKNRWALDPSNKKSNALDMAYPKLKAECTKNAAKSLGKIFGRDLNRKEKVATYEPLIMGSENNKVGIIKRSIAAGELAEASELLTMLSISAEKKAELQELINSAKPLELTA